jgi:hypothetical protein
MHRQLIELYGRVGDRFAVQRQYVCCVMTLARELGVQLAPGTQAAYAGALNNAQPPDLSKITAKTLIVWGDRDELCSVAMVVEMYTTVAHAYLWVALMPFTVSLM